MKITMTREQLDNIIRLARQEGAAATRAVYEDSPGFWERVAEAEDARFAAVKEVLGGCDADG